ncbi:unnamed protein product [marine sediment metagenome]|uniref:Uncharacterized protein n=1 Tax=marine sediment metagenome TaxID=412755 RepID=X1GMJ3_9ZZZZ
MPVLVVHLPSSPEKYNQQDQDNVRRIVEQALSTSFEVGAHAPTHFTGGADEIALNNLAGALDIAKLEADPATTRLFLVSDTGVLAYDLITVADLPAHAAEHELGGGDPINLALLSGVATKPQLPSDIVYEGDLEEDIGAAKVSDWTIAHVADAHRQMFNVLNFR